MLTLAVHVLFNLLDPADAPHHSQLETLGQSKAQD